jgi:hypothetical protein
MAIEKQRPPEPSSDHAGYRFAARPADGWRVPSRYPSCRRKLGSHVMCKNPPVADVRRLRYVVINGKDVRKFEWWAYCAEHSYGRWVEDGTVMEWFLTEVGGE